MTDSITLCDDLGRIDVLRARLVQPDVVVSEVWEFIYLNHKPISPQVQQKIVEFIKHEDITAFHWLRGWWSDVENKPQTLPTPTIAQFCWFVNYTPETPPVTFGMALRNFYQRCMEHCKTVGLPESNPGESADERKRRHNRERMAAVREHRRVPSKGISDPATLARVRELEEQIATAKGQYADLDEQWRQETLRLQVAMVEASRQRKLVASQGKEFVDSIREEIKRLIAKQ